MISEIMGPEEIAREEARQRWREIQFSLDKQLSAEEIQAFSEKFNETAKSLPRNQRLDFFSQAYNHLAEYCRIHDTTVEEVMPQFTEFKARYDDYTVRRNRISSWYHTLDGLVGPTCIAVACGSAVGGTIVGGRIAHYLGAQPDVRYVAAGIGGALLGLFGGGLAALVLEKASEALSDRKDSVVREERERLRNIITGYLISAK